MNKKINIAMFFAILLAVLLIEFFSIDLKLAGFLYRLEGNQWILSNSFITKDIIHTGGRWAVIVFSLLVIVKMVQTFFTKEDSLPYVYLVLSVATSLIIIGQLKHFTHVDCPVDLIDFGGAYRYVPLFDVRPAGWGYSGACFPAGHAGGAYSWICLFFFSLLQGKTRYSFLFIPWVIGLIFDWSQQLRGEHFLSHGFFDLLIIWTVGNIYFVVFDRLRRKRLKVRSQ